MTLRLAFAAFCALVVSLILGAVVHPFGPLDVESQTPMFKGSEIDSAMLARFQRACANCHSDHLRRPWYGYAAPVSWLLEHDVHQARSLLNFSHWRSYESQEQITLLSAMAAAIRVDAMPPARYRALHAEAVLTDADKAEIYRWIADERTRLKRTLAGKKETTTITRSSIRTKPNTERKVTP
jgi:hypothetical protein